MPFDSSGVFNRVIPGGWVADAQAGIKIRADRHDLEDDGFATGLSTCLTKDGRTMPTANLPMNNKKLTNLGDPDDPGDAANRRYVDGKFGTAFNITGIDDAGRIVFAGSQSPLATGKPLGISFTQADLFFGVKPTDIESVGKVNRWVWNDKGDGMGADVAIMDEVGNFTVAGPVTAGQNFTSSTPVAILGATGAGAVYLRPNGAHVTGGQMVLSSDGQISTSGHITAAGLVQSNGSVFGGNGAVHLRPNGIANAAGEVVVDAGGGVNFAANIQVAGIVGAVGHISAGSGVFAIGSTMGMYAGGTGRVMQFAAQWYWDWNAANGHLVYRTPVGPWMQLDGNLTIYNQAYKPGGGAWLAGSDIRIKDVRGSYEAGLEELLQIRPVRYNYKTDPDKEYIGVVAQEIETILPETVSMREGEVDGVKVPDLRDFDATALLYVAINAIKELSAKVEALEAQLAGAPE